MSSERQPLKVVLVKEGEMAISAKWTVDDKRRMLTFGMAVMVGLAR